MAILWLAILAGAGAHSSPPSSTTCSPRSSLPVGRKISQMPPRSKRSLQTRSGLHERIGLAVGWFAILFATAGDVRATSRVDVRAETAELELQSVTIHGKRASPPAICASTVVSVYRDYDGSVRLRAKQGPSWLCEETFEP